MRIIGIFVLLFGAPVFADQVAVLLHEKLIEGSEERRYPEVTATFVVPADHPVCGPDGVLWVNQARAKKVHQEVLLGEMREIKKFLDSGIVTAGLIWSIENIKLESSYIPTNLYRFTCKSIPPSSYIDGILED